jgi:O-6-methylguanine DNA methyltransferase
VPTKFQQLVWNEIEKIPFGETKSYKDIAVLIGKPRAARAVANACAKNPTPIERPCHRVICNNGQIGCYSGPRGTKTKKKLLEQESS